MVLRSPPDRSLSGRDFNPGSSMMVTRRRLVMGGTAALAAAFGAWRLTTPAPAAETFEITPHRSGVAETL